MFKTILAALALAAALSNTAQAQTANTLAESMRQSIARCDEGINFPDNENRHIAINRQCAKVQFQALQTYIDKTSECLRNPFAPGGKVELAEACKEAQILEKGLIKTFTQKPVAKK